MIKETARLLILLCCVLSAAEESRAVSSHWVDVPFVANTAFAAFPAAMPEFKNEKQLATWRAEQASKADTRPAEETHAFYTGKPYLGSTGGYAFQYRSYNPELARWTSEDPSGFPDGANGSIYAPKPTSEFDYMGLWTLHAISYLVNKTTTGHVVIDNVPTPITAHASFNCTSFAPDLSSYNITGSGFGSCDGNVANVDAPFNVSVDSTGKIYATANGGSWENVCGDMQVASTWNAIQNARGPHTLQLTYTVSAIYQGSGLTGAGIEGASLAWTLGKGKTSAQVSITFEAKE
jgi:RHS repeat-associated protein